MSYVICPINYHKGSRIFGRNAYHPKSSVCAAGIIDGSMPILGGLIGVIRMSG